MAHIMKLVVSNYNEIVEATKDPEVDGWPLMSSPGPVLTIVILYLLFVLKIGPKMMEKRPAYELKNVMIWYNASQVVFSIWLAILGLRTNFFKLVLNGSCDTRHSSNRDIIMKSSLSNAAWWYFMAKVIELLDTVFFVLRKKNKQITFLHVYHHTVMAFFSWVYLKFLPGEQGLMLGFLNSSVHIFMYMYYLIAALGPQYRKYLWWKQYMTAMQLVQFGMMFVYLMTILAMDCSMPKALTYFLVFNVVVFLYLFSDFYRKSYRMKKQA